MLLTDILQPDCIKVPLEARQKQAAIFELVDVLGGHRAIRSTDDLKQAVWEREQTRTTGIGHGIAIPHGKAAACSELCMAVGMPAEPIDFAAIDGKPVHLIILLASPLDQTGPHIQALARISRALTDVKFRAAVQQAQSPEQLYQLFAEREAVDAK